MDEDFPAREDEAVSGPEEATPDAPEDASGAEEEPVVVEALEVIEVVSGEELPPEPVALVLPAHSTRSETQGARGCWAMSNRTGEPCGAAARRGEDYCNAHSGLGVAADPRRFSPLGNEKRREQIAVRAQVRATLGITRADSPRAHLRAHAYAQRERLAATAVNGALKDPRLALRVIEAVDPPVQATISASMPSSVEEVEGMSLSQLMALAELHGITPSLPSAS